MDYGYHTLSLYVHNDVSLSPVFGQWLQVAHGSQVGSPLSCGDVLVHHAIALGLHTTVLVLLKAALNGRSSKLMPDKATFGYGFPCDGPGRGGTCDISLWNESSTYLMGWFCDETERIFAYKSEF